MFTFSPLKNCKTKETKKKHKHIKSDFTREEKLNFSYTIFMDFFSIIDKLIII